jgi:hypothetical protein
MRLRDLKSGGRLSRAAGVVVLLLGLLGPAPADATVMVELSRAELVETADLIVRCTVGAQRTRWNEDQSRILTLSTLTVREYLKGRGPGELVLRQFGGTLDGLTLTVPGDGHVSPGQEVVLFLRQGAGVVYLTAMAQSVYLVTQGVVRRDLHDVSFAAPGPHGGLVPVEPPRETDETLRHLVEAVGYYVRGRR